MNKPNSGSRNIFILAAALLAAVILVIIYIIVFKLDFKNISAASSDIAPDAVSSQQVSSAVSSQNNTAVPSGAAQANHLKNSVFIGDFVPVALGIYTNVHNSNVYADVNFNLSNISTRKISVAKKQRTTIAAVKEKRPENIYVCVGSNDVNWKKKDDVTEEYQSFVRKLKAASPDSKIYLMSLTPVTKSKASSDKHYNNSKIKNFNSWISNVAQSENVYYLDVFSALIGDNGALPNEFAESDGYHIKASGCKIIINYILSHTASDNSASQTASAPAVSSSVSQSY